MRMHNPRAPWRGFAGAHTLSRLLNGNSGVSVEMALKLSEALGTSPELWLNM